MTENTTAESTTNGSLNLKLFENENLGCNLDFAEVKKELMTIFKSPNPIHIYLNSKKIKDEFGNLISCLTKKIKEGFKIDTNDEKTFIMTVYKQSNYDKVWIDLVENYLRDAKNFDLLSYIHFVKILNKDKQYLAKGLLKLYKKDKEEDIKKFLVKYNARINFHNIKCIFDKFKIGEMNFDINLREDFVEHFIEKIYLQLEETNREIFLDNFILKINKNNLNFSDVSKVIFKVISNYTSRDKYLELLESISGKYFNEIKSSIDELIDNYNSIRGSFYVQINTLLKELNQVDRGFFWKYVKRRIIDLYYGEVRNLFYDYSSYFFVDKNTYSNLAGEIKTYESVSPEAAYIKEEYNQINSLKEIILELSNNLFSFFLLPIIYYSISEKLSIKKKDLYKVKYLLLFIFSNDYSEYKKIYMFFNQLEIFLNYSKKSRVVEKIQVSFSIILAVFLSLTISYIYFPVGVFIGIFTLSAIKGVEIAYPNIFYKLKWNIGLKFFAIVFLCISSYFRFANFEEAKNDTKDITKVVEVLGTISSQEVLEYSSKYIKANILNFGK